MILPSKTISESYLKAGAVLVPRWSRDHWFSLATESVSENQKLNVVSGVISATESESEESERFHFFRLRLRLRRLRSAYDLVKTRLSESEEEAEG